MGQCETERTSPQPKVTINVSTFGDEGLYALTYINGVPVKMLVDTGASVTILKKELFEKLPLTSKETLQPVNLSLVTATGETSAFLGKIHLDIDMGRYTFTHEVLIADIQNDGILGVDFLTPNQCDVMISKSCLLYKGGSIPCYHFNQSSKPTVCRVAVSQDVVVPPDTEVIVPGRFVDSVINTETGLVSALPNFVNKHGLLMAYGLVEPKNGVVPLRFLNVSGKSCTIPKDTVSAQMERVEINEDQVLDLNYAQACINNVNVSQEIPPHLLDLFESGSKNLNENEKAQFRSLLIKYQDTFSKDSKDIGSTDLIEHHIDTADAQPVRIPPRRIPLAKMKQAEDEIKAMAEKGIIEPCNGPWSFPVVLIPKPKDNSIRFCIDYRRLNDLSIKDSHALPRIDDTLDALAGAKMFSVVDLRSGYWNVPIAEKDKPKTAFSIPGSGLWQFNRMSFGLCNAPATFVRLMERVLRGLNWKICVVYLDDIIVYSKSFQGQIDNLSQVFDCLQKAKLKMNPKKCDLFKDKVVFLGHVISSEGTTTDPAKIESVINWPTPKTVKHVRSFIGLCSYYRRYVKNFADIARPLHKLTEKDVKFEWTETCQNSFDTMKKALTSCPVLGYPTSDDKFVIDCDASNDGMGAVLSQIQNGVEKVICYFSKAFTRQERRYCVTRRELLAVVASIRHFHHYLYGQKFLVRSDHASLKWLFKFKNPEGQIARWLETLAAYDFTIEHRAGRLHSNADSLSRRPCCESGCRYCSRAEDRYEHLCSPTVNVSDSVEVKSSSKSVETPVESVSYDNSNPRVCVLTRSQAKADKLSSGPEQTTKSKSDLHSGNDISLCDAQRRDPIIGKVYNWTVEGKRPEWQDISHECLELKHYWSRFESLHIRNDILVYKWENNTGKVVRWQILLPHDLRSEVLSMLHNTPTSAHLGVKKTIAKAKTRYFWYGMRRDIESWIQKCDECASRKAPNKRFRAPLKLYSVGIPMERLAIDVAGPLVKSSKGNRYILVISDYFTKWTQAFALKDQEATTVANVLVNEVVALFGVPKILHSDKGSNFESKVFTEMCKILGIDKTRTTTRRPQSDGMVERNIKTIKEMLTVFVNKSKRNWDHYLPLLMMAYRSAVHESTGVSPCSMMLGREITLPIDIMYGLPEKEHQISSTEYANDLSECLKFLHEFARDKLRLTGQTMKKHYDHKSCKKTYEVGMPVWLHVEKRGIGSSLEKEWHGPFVIINKLNDVIFRVQEKQSSKPKVVHHDKIKLYTGRNPPTWFTSA